MVNGKVLPTHWWIKEKGDVGDSHIARFKLVCYMVDNKILSINNNFN